MAKKSGSKQVAVTGVWEGQAKEIKKKERRESSVLCPHVSRGAVYAMGLAYPPPGILPVDESSVSALAVTQDGELYGATSGKQACMFWMPRPFLVIDIGEIKGVKAVAEDLVIDRDGIVYGAGRGKGDPLFTYDTKEGAFTRYNDSTGSIKLLRAPFRNDGVAGLAISWDKRTLAAVGDKTGRICLLDLKGRTTRTLPCVSEEGEAFSKTLCGAPDNSFYASGKDGELIRISIEGDVELLGNLLPCRRGKSYLTRASSFAVTSSARVYGGTEDGYLFSFDPATGKVVSHGRGNDIPDLHCLAEGAEGVLYGVTGRGKSLSHLVSFDPGRGEWTDLGVLASYGQYPRTAYEVGAMAAGNDGRIYLGEKDRQGHIFIYHPPFPVKPEP